MENDNQAWATDQAGEIPGSQAAMGCTCGQPRTVGVMHRSEGPCQAVYATVPVTAPATEDSARLDTLEALVEAGCVTMCFEMDGGVHLTFEPVGDEPVAYRHKNSIRDALDAARAALGQEGGMS